MALKNLLSYAEVPFDNRNISIDELLSFATDHLGRLKSGDLEGTFAGRIGPTKAALQVLQDCLATNGFRLGLRRGSKISKKKFRRALSAKVTRFHEVAAAALGEKSASMKKLFPHGRRVFGRCGDDRLKGHLETLHERMAAHESVFGAELVSQAQGLLNQWISIYEASESSTGAKAAAEQALRQARMALHLELYFNLLAIVQKYPRQPEKIALYMRPSLLEDHPRRRKSAQSAAGVPPAEE